MIRRMRKMRRIRRMFEKIGMVGMFKKVGMVEKVGICMIRRMRKMRRIDETGKGGKRVTGNQRSVTGVTKIVKKIRGKKGNYQKTILANS
ncbi:MAG: hypothetical protein AAB766_03880 [Patescibacteria group bacterium]